MPGNIVIKNLGICDYQKTWKEMKEFTLMRNDQTPDEVWLLEHQQVFTQGLAGKPEHVLNQCNIPIVQTDRGGQITYHGPGQLICYLLFDLRRLKIGVKYFVNLIENSVVQLLAEYNIKSYVKTAAPGIYVDDKKICSIGLKISHGRCYHGVALNVNNDLEPFSQINPCGFRNLQMTKINDFAKVTLGDVGKKFCEKIILNLKKIE